MSITKLGATPDTLGGAVRLDGHRLRPEFIAQCYLRSEELWWLVDRLDDGDRQNLVVCTGRWDLVPTSTVSGTASKEDTVTEGWKLTADEALERLEVFEDEEGGTVHSYVQTGFVRIGADWRYEQVADLIRKQAPGGDVRVAGKLATGMSHGVVVVREDRRPIWFQTKRPDE